MLFTLPLFRSLSYTKNIEEAPHFSLTAEGFSHISHIAICVYALSAALSIGLSQFFTTLLLAYWLLFLYLRPKQAAQASLDKNTGWANALAVPMFFWVLMSAVAALTGVNFFHAFPELFKSSLHLLLPFAVYASLTIVKLDEGEFLNRIRTYFAAFILGQALTALHSIFNTGFALEFSPGPPGPITESGQLVLVLSCLFALSLRPHTEKPQVNTPIISYAYPALLFAVCLIAAWWSTFLAPPLRSSLWAIQLCLAAFLLFAYLPPFGRYLLRIFSKQNLAFSDMSESVFGTAEFRRFLRLLAALFLAVLLINLKRGPWLGAFLQFTFLGCFLSRRLVLASISLTVVILLLLAPVRTRFFSFADDFSIDGGRQTMWALGADIAARFPMGLGPDNASEMRNFDRSLPESHRHMHNNLLNVAVESGLAGAFFYLWWICISISMGIIAWRRYGSSPDGVMQHRATIALILSLALLGWQAAGLVEYNFGDGEIKLIALVFMGILLAVMPPFPVPAAKPSALEA